MKNKKTKTCVYCTIPEIKARTIIENKLAWAFPTNIPIVPGHILISPKRCVQKFEDLTKKETEAIFDLLDKLKVSLIKRHLKLQGLILHGMKVSSRDSPSPIFIFMFYHEKLETLELQNTNQENFFIDQAAVKRVRKKNF